jgi:hypothetical protein
MRYLILALAGGAPIPGAFAQDFVQQIECSSNINPEKNTAEYARCLEQKLNEVINVVNTKLYTVINTNQTLKKEIKRIIRLINWPPREVQKFDAVPIATTIGYWRGGASHSVFECVPPPAPPEGFRVFGMEYGTEQMITAAGRGCAGSGFCDSGR